MPVLTTPSMVNTFTGSPIYPSQISGLQFLLNANTQFAWPFAIGNSLNPLSAILEVFTSTAPTDPTPPENGWQIILPPATQASPYQSAFIRNLGPNPVPTENPIAYPIQIFSYGVNGQLIASIPAASASDDPAIATAIYLYLSDNSDDAGTWNYIWMGNGATTVQAADLAGAGLKASALQLNENLLITNLTEQRDIATSDLATLIVWTGTTSANINLPDVTTPEFANGFFFMISNQNPDNIVTLIPSGSQSINTESSFVLNFGDSGFLISDGANGWYTISGALSSATAGFYTSCQINITNLASPYVEPLIYSEDQIQVFSGTNSINPFQIVFPQAQDYQYIIVNNSDSDLQLSVSGASSGTPFVTVPAGATSSIATTVAGNIYAQSGGVSSITGTSPIIVSPGNTPNVSLSTVGVALGGTGLASLTPGGILCATGATTMACSGAGSANQVLTSNGTGAPTWVTPTSAIKTIVGTPPISATPSGTQITIALSAPVSVPFGGTGVTSLTANAVLLGGSTSAAAVAAVDAPTGGGSGQFLTYQGASAAPTWTTAPPPPPSGVTSLTVNSPLSSNAITGAITLSFSSLLTVANGGTGVGTLSPNALLLGAGTSAITALPNPTSSSVQVLSCNGSMPAWGAYLFEQDLAAGTATNESSNIGLGLSALSAIISISATCKSNIGIGVSALSSLGNLVSTTAGAGVGNIAIGDNTSSSLNNASDNIAIGRDNFSAAQNAAGSGNVSIGVNAFGLDSIPPAPTTTNSPGNGNIAIGQHAMAGANTGGNYNTILGAFTTANKASNYNTIMGAFANTDKISTPNNTTVLGAFAYCSSDSNGDGGVVLGGTNGTNSIPFPNVGIGIGKVGVATFTYPVGSLHVGKTGGASDGKSNGSACIFIENSGINVPNKNAEGWYIYADGTNIYAMNPSGSRYNLTSVSDPV